MAVLCELLTLQIETTIRTGHVLNCQVWDFEHAFRKVTLKYKNMVQIGKHEIQIIRKNAYTFDSI